MKFNAKQIAELVSGTVDGEDLQPEASAEVESPEQEEN